MTELPDTSEGMTNTEFKELTLKALKELQAVSRSRFIVNSHHEEPTTPPVINRQTVQTSVARPATHEEAVAGEIPVGTIMPHPNSDTVVLVKAKHGNDTIRKDYLDDFFANKADKGYDRKHLERWKEQQGGSEWQQVDQSGATP